jgi:hypothetical protein
MKASPEAANRRHCEARRAEAIHRPRPAAWIASCFASARSRNDGWGFRSCPRDPRSSLRGPQGRSKPPPAPRGMARSRNDGSIYLQGPAVSLRPNPRRSPIPYSPPKVPGSLVKIPVCRKKIPSSRIAFPHFPARTCSGGEPSARCAWRAEAATASLRRLVLGAAASTISIHKNRNLCYDYFS